MESKVKDGNYYVVQSFMVKELGLKGNELSIYAIIYGFSQNDGSYNGSLQYLVDWTNCTKQGVLKILKSLADKDFIEKEETIKNGVKFCKYKSLPLLNKVYHPIKQNLTEGVKQSLHNNIVINNIDDIKDNKKEKEEDINSILNEQLIELQEPLKEFLKMRKAIKRPMTTRAFKLLIGKLNKLTSNIDDKIKILEQSILHSWQDVYELKTYDSNKKQDYQTNYSEQELRSYRREGDEYN